MSGANGIPHYNSVQDLYADQKLNQGFISKVFNGSVENNFAQTVGLQSVRQGASSSQGMFDDGHDEPNYYNTFRATSELEAETDTPALVEPLYTQDGVFFEGHDPYTTAGISKAKTQDSEISYYNADDIRDACGTQESDAADAVKANADFTVNINGEKYYAVIRD